MGGIGFHGNRIGTTRVGWVLEGGTGMVGMVLEKERGWEVSVRRGAAFFNQ